ncbi:MAG TPA: methyltransferase domain-containing protein, partial [Gaiellaceae bacterium]|nr:methyltransferase domain-containing protein [Gaiellaceae bacterium]
HRTSVSPTSAPRAVDAGQRARALLDRMSTTPSFKRAESFSAHLRRRHGQRAQVYEAALQDGMLPFDVKNQDLDISLDVTFGLSRDLLETQLAWFIREFEGRRTPRRLLDLGCELGILTCCYASIFPDTEVVGIDVCAPAIARAQELAGRLSVTNARFETADFTTDVGARLGPDLFDFVTESRAIEPCHRIGEDARHPGSSGETYTDTAEKPPPGWSSITAILTNIAALTAPDGTFVTLDRWQRAPAVVWFAESLVAAGFSPDWGASHVLGCHELGVPARFPIIVSHHGQPVTLDAVLGALAFIDYEQFGADGRIRPLTGAAAESLVRALRLDAPLAAAEISSPSGTQRFELWRSGGLLLVWTSTTQGHRQALLRSTAMEDDSRREIEGHLAAATQAGYRVADGVEPILRDIIAT